MKNKYLHTGNTTKKSSARARLVLLAFGVVAAVTLVGVALAAEPEHLGARSSQSQIVAENPDASNDHGIATSSSGFRTPMASVVSQAGSGTIAEKYNTLVMRVYSSDRAERDRLAQELNPEEVPTAGGFLTVIRNRDLYYALTARGVRVEIDEKSSRNLSDPQIMLDTFYGGYKSVEEIYAFLDRKVAQFPGLVEKIDIGDSWCKDASRLVRPAQSLEWLRPVRAPHYEPQHPRPQTGLLGGRRHTRPRDRYAGSSHAHDRLPA